MRLQISDIASSHLDKMKMTTGLFPRHALNQIANPSSLYAHPRTRLKRSTAALSALGAGVARSPLRSSPKLFFPLKDSFAPLSAGSRTAIIICIADAAANDFLQHLHPSFLVLGGIRVKVNHFAIVEANAEAFLDKHVAVFLFRKC